MPSPGVGGWDELEAIGKDGADVPDGPVAESEGLIAVGPDNGEHGMVVD